MAKKLTKAQIAKNPTKAINSGKMKMKKQEVPFSGIGRAAARVVGKAIVNATTGKYAARNYVESKARSDASKASVKAALKTAKKSKPLAEPKSAVRVKPAAKQKPNKPNPLKIEYKVGTGANRARAKGNDVLLASSGRKNRIQANKFNKSK